MTTAIDINTNENISIKPIAIYQSDAFDVLLLADANTGKGIWRGFDYQWYTDRREEFKTRVKAEMLVSLRVNPGAVYHAIYSSTDANVKWFDNHMAPACRKALELARMEADDSSWIDGFFQRVQGDYLICWYACWHPESGLSIPTREQWDDFLEELKSKGAVDREK